ncbi:hypothetical protein PCNPT3_11300 [Psychromonas sp. CNPT3]|uniref:(Na+)-NQR maturation NqrM n=1 Tax=Psychromonas sp. CNPT3 TaxID=314282 RepID=UPI00006E9EAB|nr:(Na+)-NQR maturation NqrM [Psychromonas sp. CNPT3]AGH82196.1 hypothetical protein PCNPT3_11300 [Psychromonas sp. CNPT3]
MLFISSFLVFISCFFLMALGVIFSHKRLRGSCGGLSSMGIKKACNCADKSAMKKDLYQIQEPTIK